MSKTHTAIACTSVGHFDAIQVPTESPGDHEVLLKIECAAMIPFDTYVNDYGYITPSFPMIFGFSAAGTIAEVGKGVDDLKVGDRVTAYTYGESRLKATQEYSVQPRHVCAKIPDSLSFEAAATIPDNFVTAFNALFNTINFALPVPSSFPATTEPPLAHSPILVYGGGSTSGQYSIQLLHASGYKNTIVTASPKHHDYLRSLGATHTLDYRSPDFVKDVTAIVTASPGGNNDGKVDLVLDCITAESTLNAIGKVVSPLGTLAILLPVKEGDKVRGTEKMYMELPEQMKGLIPQGTKVLGVRTFFYAQDEFLRDNLMPKILPQLLETGIIQPNKVRLMDESFGSFKDRVGAGLDLLRNNQISGEKVVVKVRS
ncbi:GroES-like protein [Dendrothele bispora CBS 962.96]|uniref:GroES-like protein n=1 Tax=Dendrothele bispora (strain CBS 962.96) TaxID=1314807 RepID=A0A4S8MTU1_DENBC|nr:GroES-like protein [Dendrothele bispora CBS 962.96]